MELSVFYTPHVLVTMQSMAQTGIKSLSVTALITRASTLFTFLRKERKMRIPKWLRRKTSIDFARRMLDEARREHLDAQIGEEFAKAMVSYRARVVVLTTQFLEKMEGK